MKKRYYLNKYDNISKNEAILLNSVEEFSVFSIPIIRKLTNWNNIRIKNTLDSLKKKNIITSIKKNNYVLINKIPGNFFSLANIIIKPSYISFWTALSYYGFTEQQVKTIQVVSTNYYQELKINERNIETTTFKPFRFYGYQKIENFAIAEKEKLLIDCIYKPEKAGGLNELKNCIKTCWDQINQKKLLEYIIMFKNKSIFAKLGYLLDELKLDNKYELNFIKNIPKSYTKLGNTKIYNKKWMVQI